MDHMKTVLTLLLALLIAGFAGIALQPSQYAVSRSQIIAAPPATVFALVNALKAWEQWSPWVTRDPQAAYRYQGPENGVGAIMSWPGSEALGQGGMAIIESVADDRLRLQWDVVQPYSSTSYSDFVFRTEGPGTSVTWTHSGERNFYAKAMALLTGSEDRLASDMEQGLRSLKTVAEATAAGVPN